MGHRSPTTRSPLPPRHGVDAAWVRFPDHAPWKTIGEALAATYPEHRERFRHRLASAQIVDDRGVPVDSSQPLERGMTLFYYRDLPEEARVPFEIAVLHQDDHLVVADKPHFLATMPRGRHVTESATVRLRIMLGLPHLTPVHRLDRTTAGVLLLATHPGARAPYQQMFAQRRITKEYLAVAPRLPGIELPRTVRSHITKRPGERQATEQAGTINAITHIEGAEALGNGRALYHLRPETGRTHQLRVHLNALGAPILGDDLYPAIRERADDDFTDPLQLLAASIAFTDPFTSQQRSFRSARVLEHAR
ncbi:pseudouridine synthase [Lolliginicoccus suaedae]|uniref:pseudouridine synthase n=1 Tax=Lolliginicoccus suaedae TaxID=2605429 RepID=UPI0011EC421E|nr:pseudouridine synthase [Lolliginicoccus suaedae]